MQMNVMMVIRDREMDAAMIAGLREDGHAVEVVLVLRMYALKNAEIGDISITSIVTMETQLVVMDAVVAA